MTHAKYHPWKFIQGLGLQIVAVCPSFCEEHGGIPSNQRTKETLQSTHTNSDLIPARYQYHVRVERRWLFILPIAYWHPTLNCRACSGGYLPGSVNVVVTTGLAHGKTSATTLPYVCLSQAESQFRDGIWPNRPVIDESIFDRKYWTASKFELSLDKELPTNMPQPRGMGFVIRAYVDANNAGDSITIRHCNGFLIYLNFTPVYWMSKKQTSVETRFFGSEFFDEILYWIHSWLVIQA